jgi:chromosome segregation ATPase
MAKKESSHAQEADLDRTDRLPVLDVAAFDADHKDDAVPLHASSDTAVMQALPGGESHFARAAGLDLPSLAETVRSVEARIARQNAEHEILTRDHERLREAESAAVARANALAADLAALRTELDTEQARAHDLDKSLAERTASADFAKARSEEALRDAQRVQDEARMLRESLASRDASIVQMLQSLSERDAQLLALQREHSQMLPVLEARAKTGAQLEADLQSAREHAKALGDELQASKAAMTALSAQMARSEAELRAVRKELTAVRAQSTAYLERLQTRDWRQEFSQNLFRETDSALGATQASLGALETEREQLQRQVAELSAQVASQGESIESFKSTVASNVQALSAYAEEKEQRERERTEEIERTANERAEERKLATRQHAEEKARLEREHLEAKEQHEQQLIAERKRTGRERAEEKEQSERLVAAEKERREREHAELTERTDRSIAELTEQFMGLKAEHGQVTRQLSASEEELVQLRASLKEEAQNNKNNSIEINRLQSEADVARTELSLLTAQLQEARRPTDKIEAEVRRLTEDLAAKTAKFEALDDENRNLKESLQRVRGALEEREFLIRRLERSESNNANVLGRIQTSIERLGALPGSAGAPPAAASAAAAAQAEGEWSAEMVRLDGGASVSHSIGRRTRVGRANGCELQIESSSVSRHHALIVMGPREIVIEDLNSTNGVYVNGRKITRQALNDGDLLTIGEAKFRFAAKLLPA